MPVGALTEVATENVSEADTIRHPDIQPARFDRHGPGNVPVTPLKLAMRAVDPPPTTVAEYVRFSCCGSVKQLAGSVKSIDCRAHQVGDAVDGAGVVALYVRA